MTFRQKLRPTRAQHRLLDERLERQRLLYNAALQERRDAYRLQRKTITRLDQQKSLTVIRADDPEGHGADPVTMGRWTLARVEDAFTGFFGRVKRRAGKAGFPRFKAKSRWRSFGLYEMTGLRLELGHQRIRLKGMDRPIRLCPDRALPEDARLLGATFTKVGRGWFLALTIDSASIVAPEHAHPGSAVGCDLGIEALLTLSTGERIANRRPVSRREREIRHSRRALARCRRGSNCRRKVKATLAGQLRRVADQRNDHLHKVSASLARSFALIVFEDLRIRNLTRSATGTVDEPGVNVAQKRGLNREILDAAWRRLIDYTRYKAARAGGVVKTRDARRSSGTCSGCGVYAAKPLSLRWHACACGASLHRDENAARVMLCGSSRRSPRRGRPCPWGRQRGPSGRASSQNSPRRKVLETRRQMGIINPK
ncbi:RNA-guided endonuclease InsQ/TnpB family protein [Methylobacterium gregans]|uniref:RNA-guided endonuclease InsQ/TnpB family protein n=1 Tax=Methylobacterium gregans TaxID=374424 RepID=UPI003621FC36